MALTCPKCNARVPEKSLGGTPRTECPMCRTPLVATAAPTPQPAAPAPVPSPPLSPPPTAVAATAAPPKAAASVTNEPPAELSRRSMLLSSVAAASSTRQIQTTKPARPANPSEVQVPPWLGLGLFVMFLLMAIGLFIIGWHRLGEIQASATWPTVTATITSGSVERSVVPRRRGLPNVTYTGRVYFVYAVSGQQYDGSFSETYRDEFAASQYVESFPAGVTRIVAYNPANPYRHNLKPGVITDLDIFMCRWLPLIFLALSPFGLVLFFLSKRAAERE